MAVPRTLTLLPCLILPIIHLGTHALEPYAIQHWKLNMQKPYYPNFTTVWWHLPTYLLNQQTTRSRFQSHPPPAAAWPMTAPKAWEALCKAKSLGNPRPLGRFWALKRFFSLGEFGEVGDSHFEFLVVPRCWNHQMKYTDFKKLEVQEAKNDDLIWLEKGCVWRMQNKTQQNVELVRKIYKWCFAWWNDVQMAYLDALQS